MFAPLFISTSLNVAGADDDDDKKELSVFDQAGRNLNSVRRYIERVRETERERPRTASGSPERYEWDQQSQWLEQQREMAEEFSRELHSVIATDDPIGQDEELAVLNMQYEALKKSAQTEREGSPNQGRKRKKPLPDL